MTLVKCFRFSICMASAALLSSCGGGPPSPVTEVVPAVAGVKADALVGNWGLASYQKDEDRPRTEREARAQCNRPYIVARGQNGGVMMHLADQKEPQELIIKAAAGKSYLGPVGPAATADDREVTNVGSNTFTTVWVDPDNAHRYGTMVYVRCAVK